MYGLAYRQRAIIDLSMTMRCHDPTNTRTLDVSGNGRHATLGAGDGGATTPTKLTYKKGYDFIRANGQYLIVSNPELASDEISFVIEFTPNFEADEDLALFLFDSESTDYRFFKRENVNSNTLYLKIGGTFIQEIPEATYSPYWRANQKNVIAIVSDSVNNLTNAWLNGGQIVTDDTTSWTPTTEATINIASSRGLSLYFDGQIHTFAVYPFRLTETQVKDINIQAQLRAQEI